MLERKRHGRDVIEERVDDSAGAPRFDPVSRDAVSYPRLAPLDGEAGAVLGRVDGANDRVVPQGNGAEPRLGRGDEPGEAPIASDPLAVETLDDTFLRPVNPHPQRA